MAAARVTTLRALPGRARRVVASRRTVRAMGRSPRGPERLLARALRIAASGRFDAASIAWFDRIESMRRTLETSTDTIAWFDSQTAERSTRVVGDVCLMASLPALFGRLLYALVDGFDSRRGLELGSCFGVSGAYQAAAFEQRDGGTFVTCEGAPAFAAFAERNLTALGLTCHRVVPGRFAETLPDVLAELQPIDFAYIDGHHDEHATTEYFEMLRPHLAPTSVIVFDDIHWSPGMTRAWDAIRRAPAVTVAVDARRVGITVVELGSTSADPPQYSMTLHRPFERVRRIGRH